MRPERPDLRPERPDLRTERPDWGGQMDEGMKAEKEGLLSHTRFETRMI